MKTLPKRYASLKNEQMTDQGIDYFITRQVFSIKVL